MRLALLGVWDCGRYRYMRWQAGGLCVSMAKQRQQFISGALNTTKESKKATVQHIVASRRYRTSLCPVDAFASHKPENFPGSPAWKLILPLDLPSELLAPWHTGSQ